MMSSVAVKQSRNLRLYFIKVNKRYTERTQNGYH